MTKKSCPTVPTVPHVLMFNWTFLCCRKADVEPPGAEVRDCVSAPHPGSLGYRGEAQLSQEKHLQGR